MFPDTKKIVCLILFLLSAFSLSAQKDKDEDLVIWSATQKLTLDDFSIKTKDMESGATSAQFIIDYHVGGVTLLSKNFNKRVRNYMVKSGSQIDTTGTVVVYLLYQQTLFDMSEIYARRLRKALRENRKQLFKSSAIADELNSQLMAEFVEERNRYMQETNAANFPDKQKEWETDIASRLEELKDFEFSK